MTSRAKRPLTVAGPMPISKATSTASRISFSVAPSFTASLICHCMQDSQLANCESCMQWHISEAVKDGATEKEILEAVEVAFEMGIGPATVNGRFALEVMEESFKDTAES